MSCRCISVNSQTEYDFNSTLIYPQAILIEDINQDNKNELIIGTANGEILIYKGSLSTPWLKNSKPVGCITCMAFDSISETRIKYLIVHDVLGYVYFFGINQVSNRKRHHSAAISTAKSQPIDWKPELTIVYQTKLLINPKSLIIDDINNNGTKKMIVAYNDRLVRVYGWINTNSTNSSSNANFNSINLSQNNSNNNSNKNLTSKNSSSALNSITSYSNPFQENGKFILEQSWELYDQIGSIEIYKDSLNNKHLLATQPGGRVVVCKQTQTIEPIATANSSSSSLVDLIQSSLVFSPKQKTNSSMEEVVNFYAELSSADVERSTIPTYLVANVTYNKSDQYAFLITMGGDVFFYKMSINSSTLKTPLWHCNINALVMKYYKVDINKDGNEELLIETPEGQVFVINCSGKFICFDLGEPIKMFHLGYYSTELFPVNLTDLGTSSEADLHHHHQCNNSAFDLALDASPISPHNTNNNNNINTKLEDTLFSNNVLCFVYISSITNRICLLQTEAIIAYSRLKSFTQLKYRCENIYSKRKSFSYKLYQTIENQNRNFDSKLIHDILYTD